ncbi:hypothetical protein BJ912DRAFT_886690 [Pholiota molesta]|nr:hypothetical protein BJ912DRAFT_886690 [Pholiota molesta]
MVRPKILLLIQCKPCQCQSYVCILLPFCLRRQHLSLPDVHYRYLVCDPTANLTFVSSDHVLFKIHKKHIDSNSAGFSIPENIIVGSDAVQLSEPSRTLEILFQFVEPPSKSRSYRQPSVINMELSLFFAVAEAAEKYIVYSAMNICLTRMQQLLSQNSLEILNHCAKHGYISLADEAAKEALTQSLDMVASKLIAPGVLPRYLTYYNNWRNVSDEAALWMENKSPYKCPASAYIYGLYLRQISRNPATFRDIPSVPPGIIPPCNSLQMPQNPCICLTLRHSSNQRAWKLEVVTKRDKIPKFSAVTV